MTLLTPRTEAANVAAHGTERTLPRRRRLAIRALALCLSLAALTSCIAELEDPRGDAIPQLQNPPAYLEKYADVVHLRVDLDRDIASFAITMAASEAPPKPVQITVQLDTNGDGDHDYYVLIYRRNGNTGFVVTPYRSDPVCRGPATFAEGTYRARVPVGCIESPTAIGFSVFATITDSSGEYWLDPTGVLTVAAGG